VVAKKPSDIHTNMPDWHAKIIDKAYRKQRFGIFTCYAERGLNWTVAILPVAMLSDPSRSRPSENQDQKIVILPITIANIERFNVHLREKDLFDSALKLSNERGLIRPRTNSPEEMKRLHQKLRKLQYETCLGSGLGTQCLKYRPVE